MSIEKFVALIALDPDRRQRFLADPDAELESANSNPDHYRNLIPTLERLAKSLTGMDFPAPPNDPPVGG